MKLIIILSIAVIFFSTYSLIRGLTSMRKEKKVKKGDINTVTILVFLITVSIGCIVTYFSIVWIGVGVFIFLFGLFIAQALRKLQADPPHKGQLTLFGFKIPGVYIDEGWNFLPFYPWVFGYIPINVGEITFEIKVAVRTPDKAMSEVPVSITFTGDKDNLDQYIISGKEEGVKKQLSGKVDERIREWALSDEEGPHTWLELGKSRLEGISVLLKKVVNDVVKIEPEEAHRVPTWIWILFFKNPRPEKLKKNEEGWAANNWAKVQVVFDEIRNTHGAEGINTLKESIKKREKQIDNLRTGREGIKLADLGIILKRMNLAEIQVLGKISEQAENQALEEQQRLAETDELKHFIERVADLMQGSNGYTKEQAMEIIQTERGKVPKQIKESKLSIDPATIENLNKMLSPLAQALLQKWTGGK